MNDQPLVQGIQIAALKGKQGTRTVYQAMVQNSVLNNFFTINMDPPSESSQRQIVEGHAKDIGEYIVANPDEYVLGALIYAVDQECTFTPSSISKDLGVLTIPFGTNLRCLDGQHRRKGLNEAIAQDEEFANDSTAVLIYVEPEVQKRRQMFSDMNATPRVVAKALNVKFDSRDPFARAAQRLTAEHPLLKTTTETEAARVKQNTDKWFSLGAIFDALKRLQVGAGGRVRVSTNYDEDVIVSRGKQFFDLLENSRTEFEELRKGMSTENMRAKSILLSSTTLRVLAGAINLRLQEDGELTDLAVYRDALAKVDFKPSSAMWQASGFVSPGKSTPNARNQEVLAATKALAMALGGN